MPAEDLRPGAAALRYVAKGWPVFPLHTIIAGRCSCRRPDCPHPAKHPLARHGLHDATTDEQQVRAWWDRWPWANVAITTGQASGLVVIDVDPASGGAHSLATLQSLMGSLPTTLTARTGGGGAHLFYAHPGDLRNTAGRLPGVTRPLPGLDLRADGGYVVAPPSRHRSGRPYTWGDTEAAVAPAPSWLRLTPHRRPSTPPPSWAAQEAPASRYGLAALSAELADVRSAPVGDRNNRLNRAAFCLGMLVAGGELNETLVEDELLVAAMHIGLSEAEARASIRSGLQAGATEPRRRPGA